MKNYISRPLYIKRIEPFIDKSIIKVITGQRRIGKSYILLQISDIIKKNIPEANIIFVDKEQLAFTEIRNYMDLYQYVLKKFIRSTPVLPRKYCDTLCGVLEYFLRSTLSDVRSCDQIRFYSLRHLD